LRVRDKNLSLRKRKKKKLSCLSHLKCNLDVPSLYLRIWSNYLTLIKILQEREGIQGGDQVCREGQYVSFRSILSWETCWCPAGSSTDSWHCTERAIFKEVQFLMESTFHFKFCRLYFCNSWIELHYVTMSFFCQGIALSEDPSFHLI
jgi:hypothetical protein